VLSLLVIGCVAYLLLGGKSLGLGLKVTAFVGGFRLCQEKLREMQVWLLYCDRQQSTCISATVSTGLFFMFVAVARSLHSNLSHRINSHILQIAEAMILFEQHIEELAPWVSLVCVVIRFDRKGIPPCASIILHVLKIVIHLMIISSPCPEPVTEGISICQIIDSIHILPQSSSMTLH